MKKCQNSIYGTCMLYVCLLCKSRYFYDDVRLCVCVFWVVFFGGVGGGVVVCPLFEDMLNVLVITLSIYLPTAAKTLLSAKLSYNPNHPSIHCGHAVTK